MSRPAPYSIAEMRRRARRRLPKMVFDFIDGGSEDEISWRRNMESFQDIELSPHVMRATPNCDLSTSVLGHKLDLPVIVAPTGMTGMFWPQGERAVARACAAAGSLMTVSHATTVEVSDLARESANPLWFQTLIYKDPDITRAMVDRAIDAGCHALVVTVDLQALGQRERDIRNGFTVPPKLTVANALETLTHPGWLLDHFSNPPITMVNYAQDGKTDLASLAAHMSRIFGSNVSWADLEVIRERWSGPLIIKGILRADDARLAVEHGADAIIVSNHGGRQLDTAVAPITVLPEIVDAVGDKAEVYLCSGIRRGSDVLKAVALGARACLIGRAHLYGVASAGEAGVRQCFNILGDEMRRAMALGGWDKLSDLGPDALRMPANRD